MLTQAAPQPGHRWPLRRQSPLQWAPCPRTCRPGPSRSLPGHQQAPWACTAEPDGSSPHAMTCRPDRWRQRSQARAAAANDLPTCSAEPDGQAQIGFAGRPQPASWPSRQRWRKPPGRIAASPLPGRLPPPRARARPFKGCGSAAETGRPGWGGAVPQPRRIGLRRIHSETEPG